VVLEVALIAGVNDEPKHAEQIADFIAPIKEACFDPRRKSGRTGVLVNLIPYNPTYNQPTDEDVKPPHGSDANDPTRRGSSAVGQSEGVSSATFGMPPLANGIPHFSLFQRPSWDRIDAFQDTLRSRGVWVSVRASRGDADASACGQLATNRAVARQQRRPADPAGGGPAFE
jgi:adenine C2-methylase RlmN of 23S rRNA A2503 and tRNA A37